ncbi:UDP-2,3-diacylglucosamine diphosphatase [Methylomonas sp. AM2-LC]|uniref:UDP-2,3-diacylglucosamine diphosphatase n=1 Tax=Methylomonas sp. AM2-LC TaxID=3153301 RepID=UPI0032658727
MTLKSEILFISDLHLSLEKTEITRLFLNFLEQRAIKAAALYILGDLFDAWVGDDDNTPPNPAIKKAFKQLAASGTAIYLLQGNRDFLLGFDFCKEAGITLLDEYAVINIDEPILLTHGDLLCSDDLPYQAFRVKSHSREWQQQILSKPLWVRLLAARWYRLRSYFHKRNKSQQIMDVNQDTVATIMQQYQCRILIHGHTHRPARHEFLLDNQNATRFVLADWKKSGAEVLCWNGGWLVEKI